MSCLLIKCGPQFRKETIDYFAYVSFQGAKIIVVKSLLYLRPHRPETGAHVPALYFALARCLVAGYLAVCQLAQKLGKPLVPSPVT